MMKSKTYFAMVSLIILSACKDYDCECVNTSGKVPGSPTVVVSHSNMSGRRSKMDKACRAAGDNNTTCTLKSK